MTPLPRQIARLLTLAVLFLTPGVLQADKKPPTGTPPRILLLWHDPDGHPRTTHEYQAGMRIIARQLQRHHGIQPIVVRANAPWPEGPELLDGADAAALFVSEGAKWISDDAKRLAAFKKLAARGGGLTG
ncbi:MAG: hypothetical protein VYA62_12720, partial [Planctomycetota bacterium]|nr:hypothetical protein [Planctomycetota bacterium]